jgi:DNA-3-methyladenine glycosylase II
MPTTRSSSRSATVDSEVVVPNKRKAPTSTSTTEKAPKKPRTKKAKAVTTAEDAKPPLPPSDYVEAPEESIIPAKLTFDFDEAKQHLIKYVSSVSFIPRSMLTCHSSADPRFEDLFDCMTCTPFENLEQTHPFRSVQTLVLAAELSLILLQLSC